jgi:hypothetical protein
MTVRHDVLLIDGEVCAAEGGRTYDAIDRDGTVSVKV